ncbi:MAG: hypothetical protein QOH35_4321 [Acidobacteriaceae bacterium]|nr:hypothetical protein [Acidobacteriaceae bacterium]
MGLAAKEVADCHAALNRFFSTFGAAETQELRITHTGQQLGCSLG